MKEHFISDVLSIKAFMRESKEKPFFYYLVLL